MALVLSSQTKDTVTSVAIRRLQKELKGGLTIQSVIDVPSEQLNTIIAAVGFHNKKTIFMKQIAEICKTKYNGDIPDTAEDLIALPGVGPKMVRTGALDLSSLSCQIVNRDTVLTNSN